MKGISAAIILMTIVAGSAADAAIRCEGAPGREQRGVYWSWREIDGKRCWFIRTSGAMPAKSAFTWVKEEPVEKDVPAAPRKQKRGRPFRCSESSLTRISQMSGPIGSTTHPWT